MIYTLIIILAIGVIIGAVFFITLIKNMLFVANTVEKKLTNTIEYEALTDKVKIVELSNDEKCLDRKGEMFEQNTGDVVSARKMLLTKDGDLVDEKDIYPEDGCIEVKIISDTENIPKLIFKGNQVFHTDHSKLGKMKGEFSDPSVSDVRYVSAVNERFFIMIAGSSQHEYIYPILWQVDKESLEKEQIAEDTYYEFLRPPMLFQPAGFDGYVLVYYTGEIHWGFGGDSSRPEFSYVRIYNDENPQGKGLVRFGFRAGTIFDVKWQGNALVVTGDTNRPLAVEDKARPPRIWKINF